MTGWLSVSRFPLERYRRFRQRIVRPPRIFSRPYWEDDPHYRVENHVERLQLQPPADDTSLLELINRKMNTALDFCIPIMEIYPCLTIILMVA